MNCDGVIDLVTLTTTAPTSQAATPVPQPGSRDLHGSAGRGHHHHDVRRGDLLHVERKHSFESNGTLYTGSVPLTQTTTLRAAAGQVRHDRQHTGRRNLHAPGTCPRDGCFLNGSFEGGSYANWVITSRDANAATAGSLGNQGAADGTYAVAFGSGAAAPATQCSPSRSGPFQARLTGSPSAMGHLAPQPGSRC